MCTVDDFTSEMLPVSPQTAAVLKQFQRYKYFWPWWSFRRSRFFTALFIIVIGSDVSTVGFPVVTWLEGFEWVIIIFYCITFNQSNNAFSKFSFCPIFTFFLFVLTSADWKELIIFISRQYTCRYCIFRNTIFFNYLRWFCSWFHLSDCFIFFRKWSPLPL